VGGAGAVTVDDGRQPLHVGPEHLGHGLLLGFTQLRELLGDVRHRAVVLTDLHAVDRALDAGGGGNVAGLAQRAGDLLSGCFDVVVRGRCRRLDTGQDRVDAAPRERPDRVLTADFTELTHRRRCQVVIAVVQLGAAAGGQPVPLGRSAPPLLLPPRGGSRLGFAHVD
jgi:hypothetical protein